MNKWFKIFLYNLTLVHLKAYNVMFLLLRMDFDKIIDYVCDNGVVNVVNVDELKNSGTGYYYPIFTNGDYVNKHCLIKLNNAIIGFILIVKMNIISEDPRCFFKVSYTEDDLKNGVVCPILFHRRYLDRNIVCYNGPIMLYHESHIRSNDDVYYKISRLLTDQSVDFVEKCGLIGNISLLNME